MNRHEAYKLLAEVLDSYQKKPFPDLESLVGQRISERLQAPASEGFFVDVSIEWSNQEKRRIRVSASADSTSTYRLERIEESILVTCDSDAREAFLKSVLAGETDYSITNDEIETPAI